MPYNYDYLLLLTLQGGDDLLAGGWPHDVAAFRNLGEGVVTIAGVTVVTAVATVATVIVIVLIVVVFFLVLIVILLLALGVRTTEARMIEAPDHGLLLLVVLVGVGVAQVFLWCLLFFFLAPGRASSPSPSGWAGKSSSSKPPAKYSSSSSENSYFDGFDGSARFFPLPPAMVLMRGRKALVVKGDICDWQWKHDERMDSSPDYIMAAVPLHLLCGTDEGETLCIPDGHVSAYLSA